MHYVSHMVAEPSTTGLVGQPSNASAFKTHSEWCTELAAVMMDVEEHSAALPRLTSRMSAIMKFDAGDVNDPFVRVNSLIT